MWWLRISPAPAGTQAISPAWLQWVLILEDLSSALCLIPHSAGGNNVKVWGWSGNFWFLWKVSHVKWCSAGAHRWKDVSLKQTWERMFSWSRHMKGHMMLRRNMSITQTVDGIGTSCHSLLFIVSHVCDSLYMLSLGSGTIRRCGLVEVGVSLWAYVLIPLFWLPRRGRTLSFCTMPAWMLPWSCLDNGLKLWACKPGPIKCCLYKSFLGHGVSSQHGNPN